MCWYAGNVSYVAQITNLKTQTQGKLHFQVEYDIHGIYTEKPQSSGGYSYHYSLSHSKDGVNYDLVVDENNQTKVGK